MPNTNSYFIEGISSIVGPRKKKINILKIAFVGGREINSDLMARVNLVVKMISGLTKNNKVNVLTDCQLPLSAYFAKKAHSYPISVAGLLTSIGDILAKKKRKNTIKIIRNFHGAKKKFPQKTIIDLCHIIGAVKESSLLIAAPNSKGRGRGAFAVKVAMKLNIPFIDITNDGVMEKIKKKLEEPSKQEQKVPF